MFCGIVFISINIVAIATGNNVDQYFEWIERIFLPLLLLSLAPIFLMNTGKLVFIKAFRIIAMITSLSYGFMFILDLFLMASYPFTLFGGAVTIGVLLLLFSPLQYLMWRDFRRSRWLDPTSLPHEWEIAAIRDPSSINYHPPKPTTKKPSETNKHHR